MAETVGADMCKIVKNLYVFNGEEMTFKGKSKIGPS